MKAINCLLCVTRVQLALMDALGCMSYGGGGSPENKACSRLLRAIPINLLNLVILGMVRKDLI